MVFKRREKRSIWQVVSEAVYPRGGWGRAISYISHRLRRLPDPPARIARGIAAGVFVTFTPFFGFHFFIAAAAAFLLRANLLAALLATFIGNPLTFPFIAALCLKSGEFLLGYESHVPLHKVLKTFSRAFSELWHNLKILFTGGEPHWDRLEVFFEAIFLPYLLGGLVPGVILGSAAYFLTKPIIAAYQKQRAHRLYGVPRSQL